MVRNMDSVEPAVAGAQTVERACRLLQEVAAAGAPGARILDLCSTLQLSRPTTHRILLSLAAAGFARQDAVSRRWRLGGALFELGLAAPSPVEAFPEITHEIDDLAHATGDTVYLMMRSQDDVVCAWRGVGAFPIRANIVATGDRRPMAASAAGLALLAALSPEEAAAVLERSGHRLRDTCRLTPKELVAQIAQARASGHSLGRDLVMEGVTGVGMAVPARAGSPYLAISVSAIGARITTARLPQLVEQLQQSVERIARLVSVGRAG
jgi:DNA-binding IclR family transcriptional regulator